MDCRGISPLSHVNSSWHIPRWIKKGLHVG